MNGSSAKAMPVEELLSHDGFGDRFLIRDTHGRPLHEALLLRAELSSIPAFEFALNQRLNALEQFDHASFVRVRRLTRTSGPVPRLNVISDYAGGTRLTEVLTAMEHSGAPRTPGAPLFLIREILDAVAVLHRQGTDVSHGALAPERIMVADGKVLITDYVMGSAVEQLRFSSERYWKELRVAVPAGAGAIRFDRRLDVAQVGMIALALFAGRQLRADEHMGHLGEVLMGLALAEPLRVWLMRALHMDPRRVFVSAVEAQHGLEEAMSEAGLRPSPVALDVLGLRPQRVNTTVTVRPAPKLALQPLTVVKKPALDSRTRDPWNGRDVDAFNPQGGKGTVSSGQVQKRGRGWTLLSSMALLVLIAGAFGAARFVPAPADWFSRSGTLVIDSKPQGVPLFVDGEPQGVTPATLKVKSGRHEVELRGGGKPRVLDVWVSSGAQVSQLVEVRPPARARTPRAVK